MFLLGLVLLAVGTTILAVHVTEERGCDHRMIHGGVEDTLLFLVHRFNVNAAKFFVPLVLGLRIYAVKIPARKFGGKVFGGILTTYGRDAHLYKNLLLLRRVEF